MALRDNPSSRTPHTVAAFDFDGTLTSHDSFFQFLIWQRPRTRLAADLILTFPLLLLYAAGFTGNETHKMALFSRCFEGMPVSEFQHSALEFARNRVPALIRQTALRRLIYHRELGHQVVIITASMSDWIAPWAKTHGITEVIGSCAEVRNGRLTGKLHGPNCYGEEKRRRLLSLYPERKRYRLFAYGDSNGDKELLALADEAYYRRFE